jgi:thioredoxin reductase (NADPH)
MRMPSMTGIEFLGLARGLYPTAKRVLMVDRADMDSRPQVIAASVLGEIDCHIPKPLHSPDEMFHEVITELLAAWAKDHAEGGEAVRIIGDEWSARCHQLRDLLDRYGVPFRFCPIGSPEGRTSLATVGGADSGGPVLQLFDGRVLVDPTNGEVADALGGHTDLSDDLFDVVIVGAGPAGLAAAVYAASEGLRTLVVEREAVGGQAGTTSRIRNYLGFPRGISGSDLAVRAFEQAVYFGASFRLFRETSLLQPGHPWHTLTLAEGEQVRARAVVIATGVTYRRLGVPVLEGLVGRGVFYGPAVTEAPAMAGQPVFVAGAGNSAGQAAVHLARYASRVTVLVRGRSLVASMSDHLVREIEATPNVEVRYGTEAVGGAGERRLEGLLLRDALRGREDRVAAGGLFVLIGAEPHAEWLPPEIVRCPRGYVVTGADLLTVDPGHAAARDRPPLGLETSVQGVFAAGDVRHRSTKRVASAAGEGSMVVALVHEHLARTSSQLAPA